MRAHPEVEALIAKHINDAREIDETCNLIRLTAGLIYGDWTKSRNAPTAVAMLSEDAAEHRRKAAELRALSQVGESAEGDRS